MNLLSVLSLKWKLIALGAIITALGAFITYSWYESIAKAEKAVEARLNASYKDRLLEAAKNAQLTEKKLNEQVFNNLKDKADKLQSNNDKLSIAISELRKRPQRPSSPDSSLPPSNPSSCTARELYREDAEFLTREAARAESVLIERDYYYKQYEDARKIINGNSK